MVNQDTGSEVVAAGRGGCGCGRGGRGSGCQRSGDEEGVEGMHWYLDIDVGCDQRLIYMQKRYLGLGKMWYCSCRNEICAL